MELEETNRKDSVRIRLDRIYQHLSHKYRSRTILLVIIVIALIAAIILIALIVRTKGKNVCETDVCETIAKQFYLDLDPDVDPCDDFYQFSCGGWKKRNPRPKNVDQWTKITQMAQNIAGKLKAVLNKEPESNETFAFSQARKMYKACTNFENRDEYGIRGLRHIFKGLKGFPLIGEDAKELSIQDAVVYLETLSTSFLGLFSFSVFFESSSNTTLIYIRPPYRKFAHKYLDLKNRTSQRNFEKERSKTLLAAARMFNPWMDEREMILQIDKVIEFDIEMAKLMVSHSSKYENVSLDNINTRFTGLDWKEIFTQIFAKTGLKLNENTIFRINVPKYFEDIGILVFKQNKDVIANFFGLQVLESIGSVTTVKLSEIFLNSTLTTEMKEKACFQTVEKTFQDVVTRMYIENVFDEVSLALLRNSFQQIKKSLTITFFESEWMDDRTRLRAQLKLNKMVDSIADISANVSDIVNMVDMEYFDSENFHDIYMKSSRWMLKTHLKGIKSIEMSQGSVLVVNAFYSPWENRILVKPGFLQPPAFYLNGPSAINFAAIGSIIAHEITHGFDTRGSGYNELGKEENWWDNSTSCKFQEKVKCFIDQYSNYTEPITGLKVNGEATIGDNIADNGGVRQAFTAYKLYTALYNATGNLRLPDEMDNYDDEQLFFISYANLFCENNSGHFLREQLRLDNHAPFRARVLIPLRNMEQFAKAFKCKKNSPMNPEKKCVLW